MQRENGEKGAPDAAASMPSLKPVHLQPSLNSQAMPPGISACIPAYSAHGCQDPKPPGPLTLSRSFLYSNHSHLALPFLASMLLWLPKELALPSMMNLCTEREQSGLWQCVSSTLLTHHIAIDIAITAIHWPCHLGFILLKRPWVLGRHCYPYCSFLIREETKA